jgi:hypothetical protein
MHMNASESLTYVAPFCLNRQAAIAFSSFKPSFFDEKIRPKLKELRAGTSVLYLREELEGVIRSMFEGEDAPELESLHGGEAVRSNETNAVEKKWEKRQLASTRPRTADGKSTSASMGNDFTSALKALKTRKAG